MSAATAKLLAGEGLTGADASTIAAHARRLEATADDEPTQTRRDAMLRKADQLGTIAAKLEAAGDPQNVQLSDEDLAAVAAKVPGKPPRREIDLTPAAKRAGRRAKSRAARGGIDTPARAAGDAVGAFWLVMWLTVVLLLVYWLLTAPGKASRLLGAVPNVVGWAVNLGQPGNPSTPTTTPAAAQRRAGVAAATPAPRPS